MKVIEISFLTKILSAYCRKQNKRKANNNNRKRCKSTKPGFVKLQKSMSAKESGKMTIILLKLYL